MKDGRRMPGRIAGMTVRTLFKKPSTIEYPAAGTDPAVERNYRGELTYDPSNCVGCRLCMKDCPTGALKIIKADDGMHAELDLAHCIFCCQCVDSCHKKCLGFTQKTGLSQMKREALIVNIDHPAADRTGGTEKSEPDKNGTDSQKNVST